MQASLLRGAIAALTIVWAGAVSAQEESTNRVDANTDWSVFEEADPKQCWAVSSPKETVNTRDGRVVAVRRGDILLFVSYLPSEEVAGQVSFTGGYPFQEGSTVSLGDQRADLRPVHLGRDGLGARHGGGCRDHRGDEAGRRCDPDRRLEPGHQHEGHFLAVRLHGIGRGGGGPLRGLRAVSESRRLRRRILALRRPRGGALVPTPAGRRRRWGWEHMTATAPITQDVLTIPRKAAEGPTNLVGLTRDGLRQTLIDAGTPEKQAKMRAGQLWQWIYQKGVRDFAAMTNLAKDYRADA
jgi:hypothetical protein